VTDGQTDGRLHIARSTYVLSCANKNYMYTAVVAAAVCDWNTQINYSNNINLF